MTTITITGDQLDRIVSNSRKLLNSDGSTVTNNTMDEAKIVAMSDEELKEFALGLVERAQALKNLRTEDIRIEEFNAYDRATYREPLQNLTRKIKLVRREFKNRELTDEIISKGVLE